MKVESTVKRVVLGRRSSKRTRWVISALGLFLFTGLYALVAHFIYDTKPTAILWVFVLLGIAFSIISAYQHGGLVVSWLLVLAPVCGPSASYQWLMWREGKAPIALLGNFYGHRAIGFNIPLAIVLGTLGFLFGVLFKYVTTSPTAR